MYVILMLINTIADIKKYKKGALESLKIGLKITKQYTVIEFAFDGKYRSKTYTLKIINECHKLWQTI